MYNYIINIVGVKKCSSVYGGHSWPDLLCGIKDGCEDVFKAGKYIVNICDFCTFTKNSFIAKYSCSVVTKAANNVIYREVGLVN